MTKGKRPSEEATAIERVANAAREVQAASAALEAFFASEREGQTPTLELARFAAGMQELKEAREAFDTLMSIQSR